MNKKYIAGIVICSVLLLVFILCIVGEIENVSNVKLESKTVWITSDVLEEKSEDSPIGYFVWYDDHNGETGILYTDKNGNGLRVGDSAEVYRSIHKSHSSDSTHAWRFSKKDAEKEDNIDLIIFILLAMIDSMFLYSFLKKIKRKNS